MSAGRAAVVALALGSCDRAEPPGGSDHAQPLSVLREAGDAEPAHACGGGRVMQLNFYDVGQGLAVLVDLPDGRHVLVDAGDGPRRASGCPGCAATASLVDKLESDLHGDPIDLLWITHQHADHLGGAPAVLEKLQVSTYVDNGLEPRKPEVSRAHRAALRRGTAIRVVDPEARAVPLAASPDVRLTAVLPPAWPPSCAHDPNDCSIGLRVDFCQSSVLFVGDAENAEEQLLDPGRVTVLQVGHHGSETSSTPAFLAKTRPVYGVVSAGSPGVGANRDYCHPRASIVRRLTRVMGGVTSRTLTAFDGERCDRAVPSDWVAVPSTDRLWATERDGDVRLVTAGDGRFTRR